jgi:hypothetical protein
LRIQLAFPSPKLHKCPLGVGGGWLVGLELQAFDCFKKLPSVPRSRNARLVAAA